MDGLFNLLKPAPFKSVKNGDPETLLQFFKKYVEVMGKFLTTTSAAGDVWGVQEGEGHDHSDLRKRDGQPL